MEKSPVSTYILIGINLLAYGWLAIQQKNFMLDTGSDVMAILRAGANFNPYTLGGQPWRIITSMFLHYGIIHLAVNMYGLYVLGRLLEPSLGIKRFLLVYFFCGIASGLASLIFQAFAASAGASGALFGLFGYQLAAAVIGNLHDREGLKNIFINFLIFVVINAAIATRVNVDTPGHIGGFAGGVVLAVFHFKLRWFIPEKNLAILVLLLASTLLVLPRHQVAYFRTVQRVLKAEDRTNNLFKAAKTNGELLDSLNVIIPMWDLISSSLSELKKVPREVVADTSILRSYVQLQRQETFYRAKQIERESYVYLDSMEIVNAKFDSLPRLQPATLEIMKILKYDGRNMSPSPEDMLSTEPPPLRQTTVYYDEHWRETKDMMSAKFYRLGQKDSLGRWQGPVFDYYKNGQIQMKGKYLRDMKDGVFRYYSDRRTYEAVGRYEKELAVGKWENFHWNGKLESEVFYGDETFTANVFDSLGNPQVINGNGKATRWYASGQIAEEGEYKNGKKEGLWYGYHPDGKPYYKEQYRNNRLVHGASEARDGRRYVYDYLSEIPFPVKGMPAFKKYVEHNKRLPFLRSSRGKVKLMFTVGVDGTIWNYVILQNVSPECDDEAIRLVKEGPAWRPALIHGQEKIQSPGYVEIDF